jgi:hypothetical protein
MRNLFYVSIIHAPEDLGSYLEEVKSQYIAIHGPAKWRSHLKALEKFWQGLTKTLLSLPVDYTRVKLYQDSLPVCGNELDIVRKLAKGGNRNYRLLFKLVKKGAMVMGTEDPDLLVKERERFSQKSTTASYDDLMKRRDQYIAHRIDSTLKDSEIGLLLIGALHKVIDELPEDIRVHRSLNDLKEKGLK